jgi:hypothetical protein
MKQLLTVMAVIFIATLTQGFTTPTNKSATSGIHADHSSWQNTSWVNPFIKPGTVSSKRMSLADAQIDWSYDPFYTWYPHLYYHIYVNGVLVVNPSPTMGETGTLYVAPGSTVFFEIESDARESGPMGFVYDYTAGVEILNQYSTHLDYASATFTAQDGHVYEIRGR